jgi:hypothetical protein
MYLLGAGGRVVSNTLASDASGPNSIPGQGTLEDVSSFHPIRVSKLSTSFSWEVEGSCI